MLEWNLSLIALWGDSNSSGVWAELFCGKGSSMQAMICGPKRIIIKKCIRYNKKNTSFMECFRH